MTNVTNFTDTHPRACVIAQHVAGIVDSSLMPVDAEKNCKGFD